MSQGAVSHHRQELGGYFGNHFVLEMWDTDLQNEPKACFAFQLCFLQSQALFFSFTEADGKLSLYFETSLKMRLKSPAL